MLLSHNCKTFVHVLVPHAKIKAKILNSGFWKAKILKKSNILKSGKMLSSRFWKAKILNLGFWEAKILKSAKILNSGFWKGKVLN